jgi:hypothetical protein
MEGVVAFNGDASEYAKLLDLFKNAKTPEAEKRCLMALGMFRQPELVEKSLNFALSKDVRSQDGPTILALLLNNRYDNKLAWTFVTENWQKIVHTYPDHITARIIAGTESFSTPALETSLKDFASTHTVPYGARTVAETLERVHANNLFVQRSGAELASWLVDYSKKTEAASEPSSTSHAGS